MFTFKLPNYQIGTVLKMQVAQTYPQERKFPYLFSFLERVLHVDKRSQGERINIFWRRRWPVASD